MGRPKMLLPWGEWTVLGHLLAVWSALAQQVAVVTAKEDALIGGELDRIAFPPENRITNAARERGMFSSITSAAVWPGWSDSLTHFAIVLGDQPNLNLTMTLVPLLRLAETNPGHICQPSFRGRPRHPVILPRVIFDELRATSTATLKEFLAPRAQMMSYSPSDDPALDLDLDVPADYERAYGMFFGEPPRSP
jgi:molybdenum cofactor cytidylyltransferase